MNIDSSYYDNNSHNVPRLHVMSNGVRMYGEFDSEAERDALVALFPKFVKVTSSSCYCLDGVQRASIDFHVNFTADAVNGGANETGLKRLRRLVDVLDANGGVKLHCIDTMSHPETLIALLDGQIA